MKSIRAFRIVLASVFFVASVALLIAGGDAFPALRLARMAQIIPSALSATLGATLFWFALSFLLGRVYCSTVCPLGTWQDIAIWIRRKCRPDRRFSFSRPRRCRYDILIIYVVCLILGISTVCALLEPWPLLANAMTPVNGEDTAVMWPRLAFGGIIGIAVSIAVVLAIFVSALFNGREFCTTICPVGTILGASDERALYHIEIDPDKCSGCLKCEDRCPSKCIKVVSRYVDNSRCVRCFDCINVCPDDAIRFQINRNRRPATPLLRKKKKA